MEVAVDRAESAVAVAPEPSPDLRDECRMLVDLADIMRRKGYPDWAELLLEEARRLGISAT